MGTAGSSAALCRAAPAGALAAGAGGRRARYLPLPMRLGPPIALLLAAMLAVAGCGLDDENGGTPPQLGAEADDEEAAVKLGFPSTATGNTIRVGGGDAVADAAGVVSAIFPATSAETRPPAVALVDRGAWQAGIAAAVLASDPLGVPTLLTDGDELPAVTADTLARLDPQGSDLSEDAQVIRVGEAAPAPSGLRSAVIRGKDPFELAAAIDRYSTVAHGEPSESVVVASGERPAYAMPAAAWAARSGDSVLFVKRSSVPAATKKALRRHDKPDIYLLGPERVIGEKVEKELGELGKVRRIEGRTPVENAIAFARYERRGFGWGITVPGYNFAVANTARPMDAVAAAPLAANGVFAPLLLTDDARTLPRSLESYFLDVQPGYVEDDPSDAVYNRVWILGDDDAVSIAEQARIDRTAELVPVQTRSP